MTQDSQYQETFVYFLTEIKQERLDIILEDVNVGEDYCIGSSFRRGAEFRFLNTRSPETVISDIHLWQQIERSKGKHPRFSMLQHNADVTMIMDTILQLYRPL